MINNYKKYLIVVAHPDDEVLGCGGTIKKLSRSNKNIKVIFIAEGTSCRYKKNQIKYKKEISKSIKSRKKYALSALKDLGVKNSEFYDLECGKLNSIPITKISNIIEEEIKIFRPEIIITHSDNDVNMDHKAVYQGCLQSTRPTNKLNIIGGLLSFEILSSTEWKYSKIFEPNLFVNIDKEIKFKMKAIKRYKSEIRKFPHPRSIEAIDALAKYRGTQSHNKYAEAFKIVRIFSK